ncbi:helix-turn-helix domain-containing protein [Variovorax sp. PAMC 28711]|uniref:helix-turn-helix domain-containing protein n=1 Tax=Variovorax sp. PAMC 28711 TaxID=1795631 RepID=UPI00078CD428|nr:XRE family transcriptional regulator [Variovorax sp. PAMC 28711]AMM26678.1 DNA-binding protein [Variovorax sp. PAMC 28711]
MTEKSVAADDINQRIARRVTALRAERGLSLEALAARSGVSRSTISLIERGETSATAVVLDRLAAGLGLALAALFEVERAAPSPLMRHSEQPVWRDPASGYLRRNVSPPDHPSALRIVEVEFPAGERVVLEGARPDAVLEQQVWLLEGKIELRHGGQTWQLTPGDCLAMRLDGPLEYRNPTDRPARYAVLIANESAPIGRKSSAPGHSRQARTAARSAKAIQ